MKAHTLREIHLPEGFKRLLFRAVLKREILPSEKAFAYKMKLEALERKAGRPSKDNCGQVGHNLRTRELIAEKGDDSARQIQRFIRLTNLISPLLEMVDEGKIAFNPAVELSYLSEEQQGILLESMSANVCTPSHAQAIRLKKAAQEGTLDNNLIHSIMAEEKPNQREQIRLKREDLRQYFPNSYTDEQIRRDILKGLELLRRQRERSRDAR